MRKSIVIILLSYATAAYAGSGLMQKGVNSATQGLWHFNEGSGSNFTDNTSNSNNGSISGASWSESGVFDNCLSFDGINDYATIQSSSFGSTEGTIMFWIKFKTISSSPNRLFFDFATTPHVVRIQNDNENLGYAIRGSNYDNLGGWWSGGFTSLKTYTWYHLAVAYSQNETALYVNGEKKASDTGNLGTITWDPNVYLAAIDGGGDYNADIFMDELSVSNKRMTAAEIEQEYLKQSGSYK